MVNKSLKNVPLKLYKEYLEYLGCKCIRTNGGNEIWSRNDLLRPIVVQSHISPVPEFIIKNGFKQLGVTKEEFNDWLTS